MLLGKVDLLVQYKVAFKMYDQDSFVNTSLHACMHCKSMIVLGLFDYFSIVILSFNLQLRFFIFLN